MGYELFRCTTCSTVVAQAGRPSDCPVCDHTAGFSAGSDFQRITEATEK